MNQIFIFLVFILLILLALLVTVQSITNKSISGNLNKSISGNLNKLISGGLNKSISGGLNKSISGGLNKSISNKSISGSFNQQFKGGDEKRLTLYKEASSIPSKITKIIINDDEISITRHEPISPTSLVSFTYQDLPYDLFITSDNLLTLNQGQIQLLDKQPLEFNGENIATVTFNDSVVAASSVVTTPVTAHTSSVELEDLLELQEHIRILKEKLDESVTTRNENRKELDNLQHEIEHLKSQDKIIKLEVANRESELLALTNTNSEIELELERLTTNGVSNITELSNIHNSIPGATHEDRVKYLEDELVANNTKIEELTEEIAKLTTDNQLLVTKISEIQFAIDTKQKESKELNSHIEKLQVLLDEANKVLDKYKAGILEANINLTRIIEHENYWI